MLRQRLLVMCLIRHHVRAATAEPYYLGFHFRPPIQRMLRRPIPRTLLVSSQGPGRVAFTRWRTKMTMDAITVPAPLHPPFPSPISLSPSPPRLPPSSPLPSPLSPAPFRPPAPPRIVCHREPLSQPWTGVAHGLSTYSRLAGDVATPGFSDTVTKETTVDLIACQKLLDRVADRVVGHGCSG